MSNSPVTNSNGPARIEAAKFEPLSSKKSVRSIGINPRLCLVVTLLALAAFCAWFMLTAKAVYIETEPSNADVDISGTLKLKLANRYLVRPGAHGLSLSAEGYHPLQEMLNVTTEAAQHYIYRLEKLPGHLLIDSGAVTGAEVLLDGVSRGETPLDLRNLAPGEYAVEIRAERYFPFRAEVMLEGLDREQSLNAELKPAWAEISFASEPPDAQVFSRDEMLGATPLTAQLLEGRHEVRIKAAGYKVWQDSITVVAGEPQAVTGIRLEPADAALFLVSSPARANATVNGNFLGLTPLEVPLTPGEATRIRLFKQGYKPAARSVTAKSGEQKRLSVTLEPELVPVVVRVEPGDAKIFVDGAPVGEGNRTLQLSTNKHQVEVRKQGYVDYKTTLTPHIGVDHELVVRLKTVKQAKLEALKPVITAPAGQTLKLFYPGAVTMGASRREPGRGANETLRNVKLTRPFYLGQTEVTNREYRLFDKGFSSGAVRGNSLNGDTQPAANLTWEQAAGYCNWLSKEESLTPFYIEEDGRITGFDKAADGYRLPTEAEWAWAARTTNTGATLKFPWGAEMPPAKNSGNYADRKAAALFGRIIGNYDDGYVVSAPVGSFTPNDKGLFDLGGNVAEWVNDFYDVVVSVGGKVELDPMGPASGEFHVIRGSSWAHGAITGLRLSFRDYGNKARNDVGFRIARYAD